MPESTLKWVQTTIKLYCGWDFRLHVFSPQEEIYGLKYVGGRRGSWGIYW